MNDLGHFNMWLWGNLWGVKNKKKLAKKLGYKIRKPVPRKPGKVIYPDTLYNRKKLKKIKPHEIKEE
jgi:hypothetical protein